MKTVLEIQTIIKGAANKNRIRILFLLTKSPNLSVVEIAEAVNINFRTASDHTFRLANSGLIIKKRKNKRVEHVMTELGYQMLSFIRSL